MTTEAIFGLAIIYLIVHALIVLFTKKLSWSARSAYEKIVTVLGIIFAILLAIGSAAMYLNPETVPEEIIGTETAESDSDNEVYAFTKYNVSIEHPYYLQPSEYPSEDSPYQITAFYDGNSNSPVVLSVSDLLTVDMMKATIAESYATLSDETQKTINGRTFDVQSYEQEGIYSSMDVYFLQEGSTMFILTFYNHLDYDDETNAFLKTVAEGMLETLQIN
jgi:hypothetical protein